MNDDVLRAGLLDGVTIVVAGVRGDVLGTAVKTRCAELGATVREVAVANMGEEALVAAAAELVSDCGRVDALVNDGASLFTSAGDGLVALRACLDGCWNATRALANAALIDDVRHDDRAMTGGRIVSLAPRPQAGELARAARAGLENLARTLSIEWARHGIATTTITPGDRTDPAIVAELVAFLLSPAGGYYSGCLFALDSGP